MDVKRFLRCLPTKVSTAATTQQAEQAVTESSITEEASSSTDLKTEQVEVTTQESENVVTTDEVQTLTDSTSEPAAPETEFETKHES